MRIVERLTARALLAGAVLSVLLPTFIWTALEFSQSKADYLLAGNIEETMSRSEELRNQYYLYREDRVRHTHASCKHEAGNGAAGEGTV